MALVANANIPVPYAEGEAPEDPMLARLQQKVLKTGDKIDPKTFSKEELDSLKASGAVVEEGEFVSDEEKYFASSLTGLDAFRAGKKAAFAEENPDATEEEIDKQGNVIVPLSESPPVKNRTTSPAGKNADQ